MQWGVASRSSRQSDCALTAVAVPPAVDCIGRYGYLFSGVTTAVAAGFIPWLVIVAQQHRNSALAPNTASVRRPWVATPPFVLFRYDGPHAPLTPPITLLCCDARLSELGSEASARVQGKPGN